MLMLLWRTFVLLSLGGAVSVDLLKTFSIKLKNEFIHPLVDFTVLFLVNVTGWSFLFGLKFHIPLIVNWFHLNDFWRFSIRAFQVQVSFTDYKNHKIPETQPSYIFHHNLYILSLPVSDWFVDCFVWMKRSLYNGITCT